MFSFLLGLSKMGIRRLDGAEANNGLFGNRIILIITNHPPITKRVKQSSLPELPTRTQNTDAPFTAYLLPVLTDPVLRDHHLIKTLNFFFLTLTP